MAVTYSTKRSIHALCLAHDWAEIAEAMRASAWSRSCSASSLRMEGSVGPSRGRRWRMRASAARPFASEPSGVRGSALLSDGRRKRWSYEGCMRVCDRTPNPTSGASHATVPLGEKNPRRARRSRESWCGALCRGRGAEWRKSTTLLEEGRGRQRLRARGQLAGTS